METLKVISGVAGLVLLVVGIVNAVLMGEVMGRKGAQKNYRSLHKLLGRMFAVISILLFIFMIPRAAHFGQFPAYAVFHATAGICLIVLVAAKYLIAARYKSFTGALPVYGVALLSLTCIVVFLSSIHGVAERVFG